MATAVFVGGVAGPVADALLRNRQPVGTVVAVHLTLLVFWVVSFGWMGAIRDETGACSGKAVLCRIRVLWQAFLEGYPELLRAEARLREASLGALLVFVGSLLLGIRGMTLLVAVCSDTHQTSSSTGAGLFWVGLASWVLGAALHAKATRGLGPASPEAVKSAIASLLELPAIIDLNRDSGRRFGEKNPLLVTLSALGQWRTHGVRSCDDAYAYQLALERLLRGRVGRLRCRSGVWLGSVRADGIADLVLGELLFIHVTRGFSTQAVTRAVEQIRLYQRKKPNLPKLLVVFDADQRAVFENATVAMLQSLREETATITVRM